MNVSGRGYVSGSFRGQPVPQGEIGREKPLRFGAEPALLPAFSRLEVGHCGEMGGAAEILGCCTGIPHVKLDLLFAASLPKGVAKALSNNCSISRLDVTGAAAMSVEDLGFWMAAIGRMNGLTHLTIDISRWSTQQCGTIARCLGRFSNLRTLDLLGGGQCVPQGVIEAVRTCPWLHHQDVVASTSQIDFDDSPLPPGYLEPVFHGSMEGRNAFDPGSQQRPGTPSWQTIAMPVTPSTPGVTTYMNPPATPNQDNPFDQFFFGQVPTPSGDIPWGNDFAWGSDSSTS